MEDEKPKQEAARVLDIRQIMSILPHRYPFLLIDRVLEVSPRKRIVAIKNVTINEHFFQGHFPDYAIMPGVLMVEAIAQAGGVLLLPEIPEHETKLMVFSGIDRARFRRPVVPGDQLRIEVDVLNWKPRAARLEGKVYVERKLVCEATIMCQVVPRPAKIVNVSENATPPSIDPTVAPELEPVNQE
jgi:3-hydroxyacyl-[acyl-carrier-protein] dehydratase